jgi:ribonuclease BN (tRNA processing enzyme)
MKIKFLGNGSGFTNSHNNAYFVTKNNDLVLIDLSMMHYETITNFPLSKFNNIYILVTHMHDEHTSGIGMIIQYCHYVLKKDLTITVPCTLLNVIKRELAIKGILEDIYNITYLDDKLEWFVKTISVEHAPELNNFTSGYCYGYVLNIDNTICIYSGDTNSIEPFMEYVKNGCEFYIDVSYSYGGVHVKYDDVKDKLIELSNNGVKVILMHLDDIKSIKRVINGTKLQIAEINLMNYYSDLEIEAIKEEICFTKTDIINKIDSIKKDKSLRENTINKLNKLLENLNNENIETIIPDFTTKKITAYVVDIMEVKIVKTECEDFYFEYDKNDKIYCASFIW